MLPIPVSQSKYNALLEVLNMTTLNNVATTSDTDLLWQMTLTTGQPFIFLTPPVSTCQNTCCKLFCKEESLSSHHDPVVSTVYTLNAGQEPAFKHPLRCRNCSWIYGYSMYGRKQHDGVRFQRDLIEITDVVFCDRKLYELFCCLRYNTFTLACMLMHGSYNIIIVFIVGPHFLDLLKLTLNIAAHAVMTKLLGSISGMPSGGKKVHLIIRLTVGVS